LSAPTRTIELVFFTSAELFVQGLNIQWKQPDDTDSEHLLESDEMFVRHLGATAFHVGEHLAADIHPYALQARRHEFLAQTQFMAFFSQERAEDIQAFHNDFFQFPSAKTRQKTIPFHFLRLGFDWKGIQEAVTRQWQAMLFLN